MLKYVHLMVLVACLALIGCGSSTPPPAVTIAAAPLPAGWQQATLPGGSLALPPDWSVVAPTDTGLTDALAEAAAQNPQLGAALERSRAELAAGMVQLIAFDLEPNDASQVLYPTNVRVAQQALPNGATLAAVSDANEADLKGTPGFSDVVRAPVQLAERPATRLTSRLTINDGVGEPLPLIVEQYLFVQNADVYVVTFSTPAASQAQYRAVYDQVLATLRIDE